MSLANILQRRVKPRKYDSEDDETSSIEQELESEKPPFNDDLSSSEVSEDSESEQQHQTNEAGANHEVSDSDPDSDTDTSPETLEDVNSISFGALAKAQESLGNLKGRRGDSDFTSEYSKKPRLYGTGSGLGSGSDPESHPQERSNAERKQGKTSDLSRSSKHAPAQQTSKKPVSRRRDVIPTLKLHRRDPRFEALGGATASGVNEERIKKNYAFLDSYRESEMAELRTAIRTTKDEHAQAELKRALLVMESRKKTQDAKDLRQKVVRDHRAREKELVKQGKKPFYLKKAELQRRTLKERFEKLGEKQVDKAIERRRKKKAGAERKQIPKERRVSR